MLPYHYIESNQDAQALFWKLRKFTCIDDDHVYVEYFYYEESYPPYSGTVPNFKPICRDGPSNLKNRTLYPENIISRTVSFKSGKLK